MCRGAAVPFLVFLVVGVGPGLAAPPNPYSLPTEELLTKIILNQVSLQHAMNDSTASSAAYGDELNQMREDIEEGWRTMNQSVMGEMNDMATVINNKIERINQRVVKGRNGMEVEINNKIHEINESMVEGMNDMETEVNNINSKIDGINQRVVEEMNGVEVEINNINNKIDGISQRVNRWMNDMNARRMNDTQHIMEKLEAVQNAADDHHPRPGVDELYANHNDSHTSLCDGHKVLYGGDGYFEVTSSGNYGNNLKCSWTVTLPEGTRPVFRWKYFDIEDCSTRCTCDFVVVRDLDHDTSYYYCGDNPPDGSFLTIMNNKFKVWFQSDGSGTGRGFKLGYRSVLMD